MAIEVGKLNPFTCIKFFLNQLILIIVLKVMENIIYVNNIQSPYYFNEWN